MTIFKCKIASCKNKNKGSLGWCLAHYQAWYKYGDPLGASRREIPGTDEERFFAQIKKLDSGCWEWQRTLAGAGYGSFWLWGRNKRVYAHVWAYNHFVGQIPKGKEIDHLCRNRKCANPSHLEVVDHRTNMMRGDTIAAKNYAKTHCIHGHKLSGENLVIDAGARRCLICRRLCAKKRIKMRTKEERDHYANYYHEYYLRKKKKWNVVNMVEA